MEPHPAQLLIVSPEILRRHLIAFEREINSKRLQSKIKSISDLIIVLYKRSVINRNNFANVLQNVLNDFTSVSDKVKIKDFVNLLDRQSDCSDTNVNQYALQKLNRAKLESAACPAVAAVSAKSDFNGKKSQVYKVIANMMGTTYREFGRELNLTESELQNLERQPSTDLPTITRRILEIVEARRTDNLVDQLISALEESGRKDIVRKIRNLLNQ